MQGQESVNRANRDSNMELLRIVSILFVTTHHFLTHGAFPGIFDEGTPISTDASFALMLNGFVYIGVNCFVLISGYFGIKCRWKGILNFLLICVSYNLVGYFLHLGLDHQHIGRSLFSNIFFLTHSNWWFVNCYLGLWLCSPILNKAIENFSKKEYQLSLLLLAVSSLYIGYCREVRFFDNNGYSLFHFVFVYMIGGYFRKHQTLNNAERKRNYSTWVFTLSALLWGTLSIMCHYYKIPYWHISRYNNPIILVTSIAFFYIFTTIHFQNRLVNAIASSVFPVYLLQEHFYVKVHLYGFIERIYYSIPPPCYSLGIIAIIMCAIIFVVMVCCIDRFRIWIFDYIFTAIERLKVLCRNH